MRAPSATLVLDAAILISAAGGRSAGAITEALRNAVLVTTDRVIEEARRRIELGLKRPDLLTIIDALAEEITIVPVTTLEPLLAVASRNGSTKDAHVLALAWDVDADIWTTDRDFAGTGVATWSTPNLLEALENAERIRS